jgi:hypothetical protein
MRITVQLSDMAARSLGAPAREPRRDDPLSTLARELHVSLEPTHPDSPDPTLRTWYSVDVPDEATAHSVATQLRRRPEVVAAFVKPPDAMP